MTFHIFQQRMNDLKTWKPFVVMCKTQATAKMKAGKKKKKKKKLRLNRVQPMSLNPDFIY